jgi:hypothetical protein
MLEEIKQIEIKQTENNINDIYEPVVWRSCCFSMDSHFVSYLGQFIFSMSVLAFCSVMLIKADGSCEQSSSYINIISFMMGKILSSVMSSTSK